VRFASVYRNFREAKDFGSGTVLADDPYLTCRLPGMGGRSPVRIVADGSLRVPLTARVAATAREAPTWFLVRHGISGDRRDAFKGCGVEIIDVPATPSGETDLGKALQELGKRGITRLLVEGGATIATSMLRADLVDRLYWFRAPSVIGGDGLPALTDLGLATPSQAPRFARLALETVGEDVLEPKGT
jgi:diaminohydroxyphosphoribosylaminopyrimidine deaminase / 5-amino-6-(5-phosphoribosylamino)uracil reductase